MSNLDTIAGIANRVRIKTAIAARELKRFQSGIHLCVLGFGVTFFAFYPGFMSWDSVNQYEQALSGEYNDYQPPVMAVLWSVLNRISTGPQIMLFFHLVLYWSGFLLFYAAYRHRNSRLAIYFPLAAFCPWLLNTAGVIWKDVGLAVAWTFCAALLACHASNKRRIGFFSGAAIYAFFLYGYMVRNNAFVSAPFLLLLIVHAHLSLNKPEILKKRIAVVAFVIAALAGATLLSIVFNRAVSTRAFQTQYVLLDDLAAIYRATGKEYFPDYIKERERYGDFLEDIGRIRLGALFYPSNSYFATRDKNAYASLRDQWIKAVRENFGIYIRYRCGVFFDMFLTPDYNAAKSEYFSIISNPHGLAFEPGRLFIGYKWAAQSIRRALPFLFKPVFWLGLNVALLFVIIARKSFRKDLFLWVLWLVSFSYFIGYLAYLPVPDFRFIYLSMMFSMLLPGIMANQAYLEMRPAVSSRQEQERKNADRI